MRFITSLLDDNGRQQVALKGRYMADTFTEFIIRSVFVARTSQADDVLCYAVFGSVTTWENTMSFGALRLHNTIHTLLPTFTFSFSVQNE